MPITNDAGQSSGVAPSGALLHGPLQNTVDMLFSHGRKIGIEHMHATSKECDYRDTSSWLVMCAYLPNLPVCLHCGAYYGKVLFQLW